VGYHWEWFGTRKTKVDLQATLLPLLGFRPTRVVRQSTMKQMIDAVARPQPESAAYGVCEFRGWTFLYGMGMFWDDDLKRVAKELSADAVSAIADSDTGTQSFQYAKPDGTFRSRRFSPEKVDTKDYDWSSVVKRPEDLEVLKDNPFLEGYFDIEKDSVEGEPLPGEPLDIALADDESLLIVLGGLGVPLGPLIDYHVGRVDFEKRKFVPGKGVLDRSLTIYFGELKEASTHSSRSTV